MDKILSAIHETALSSDFSGVVSIFKEDIPLFNEVYGYRDIKNQLPNRTDTLFGTASGTKLFTALGIGVLIDQGKLRLDSQVGELSSDFHSFIDEHASIRQLLSHTSGIYDYYDEEIDQDFDNFKTEIPWNELATPSDYLPIFAGKRRKFEAGKRFSYSNGGFVFLGILIEKLSGQLYRDFVQKTVLDPAGMTHSGFFATNDLPANTANGYLEDRRRTNIFQLPIRGGGDGGMYTTSTDLQSFWSYLFSQKIISKSLLEEFLRTQYEFDEKRGYGCGIYKWLDDTMYYIVGGDAGIGFDSRFLPGCKLTINILANLTNGEAEMRRTIMNSLDDI
jgi:CubicO group peptidase (beta-lactamase class C family)